MKIPKLNFARAALPAAAAVLAAASSARAGVKVRLVHLPDGKPVPDAVIFATRLDMAPEGMETMTASVEAMPGAEPGIYPFKVNLTMQGGWQFSLGAKVQGESETLESKLQLRANP
jgi:hypothetical protein